MKINKTSHPIRFHYPGEISKFISRDRQGRGDKSIWFWEKFDLKIKSEGTLVDMVLFGPSEI